MKDKQKIFLNKLSYPVTQEIDGIRFLVCHGSPDNINQYLYPDNNVIFELFKKYINKIDIVVLGHTHYQAKWEVGPLNIINPGSVGQPRSGEFNPNRVKEKCRAEWAMYDTKTMKFDFRNTFYDGSNLIKQIEKLDPEIIFLKNVLLRDLD